MKRPADDDWRLALNQHHLLVALHHPDLGKRHGGVEAGSAGAEGQLRLKMEARHVLPTCCEPMMGRCPFKQNNNQTFEMWSSFSRLAGDLQSAVAEVINEDGTAGESTESDGREGEAGVSDVVAELRQTAHRKDRELAATREQLEALELEHQRLLRCAGG